MNVSQQPFTPTPHGTIVIAVSATSQSSQIQTVEDANSVLRIYNDGTAAVFVETDGASPTASLTNSMPVPSKGVVLIGNPQQYVAVIAAGATGNVYFTPGNGVS